jgi:hypothetical protein
MPSVSFLFFYKEDAFSFEWKSSGFTPSHVLSHSGPFSSSTTAAPREKGKRSNGMEMTQSSSMDVFSCSEKAEKCTVARFSFI